jgi:hypothetical protein
MPNPNAVPNETFTEQHYRFFADPTAYAKDVPPAAITKMLQWSLTHPGSHLPEEFFLTNAAKIQGLATLTEWGRTRWRGRLRYFLKAHRNNHTLPVEKPFDVLLQPDGTAIWPSSLTPGFGQPTSRSLQNQRGRWRD